MDNDHGSLYYNTHSTLMQECSSDRERLLETYFICKQLNYIHKHPWNVLQNLIDVLCLMLKSRLLKNRYIQSEKSLNLAINRPSVRSIAFAKFSDFYLAT